MLSIAKVVIFGCTFIGYSVLAMDLEPKNNIQTNSPLGQLLLIQISSKTPEYDEILDLLEYPNVDPAAHADSQGKTSLHHMFELPMNEKSARIIQTIINMTTHGWDTKDAFDKTPFDYFNPASWHSSFVEPVAHALKRSLNKEEARAALGSILNSALAKPTQTSIKAAALLANIGALITTAPDITGKTPAHNLFALPETPETFFLFKKLLKKPINWTIKDNNGKIALDYFDPGQKHRIYAHLVLRSLHKGHALIPIMRYQKKWLIESFTNHEYPLNVPFIENLFEIFDQSIVCANSDGNTVFHNYFQLEPKQLPQELDAETNKMIAIDAANLKEESELLRKMLIRCKNENWNEANMQGKRPLDYFDHQKNPYNAQVLLKESFATRHHPLVIKTVKPAIEQLAFKNELKSIEEMILYGIKPTDKIDKHGNTLAHLFFKHAHISEDNIQKWEESRKPYPRVARLIITYINHRKSWNKKNNEGQMIFDLFTPKKDSDHLPSVAHELIKDEVVNGIIQAHNELKIDLNLESFEDKYELALWCLKHMTEK